MDSNGVPDDEVEIVCFSREANQSGHRQGMEGNAGGASGEINAHIASSPSELDTSLLGNGAAHNQEACESGHQQELDTSLLGNGAAHNQEACESGHQESTVGNTTGPSGIVTGNEDEIVPPKPSTLSKQRGKLRNLNDIAGPPPKRAKLSKQDKNFKDPNDITGPSSRVTGKSGKLAPPNRFKKIASKSPPPECPLCLEPFKNKCFLDPCMHEYCFMCIYNWCERSPTCPLCIRYIKRIIHNLRSDDDYDICPVYVGPDTDSDESTSSSDDTKDDNTAQIEVPDSNNSNPINRNEPDAAIAEDREELGPSTSAGNRPNYNTRLAAKRRDENQ